MRAVAAERLGDLQREFPRRRQHQRLRDLFGGVDLGQDRDGEGGGLSGSGLGEADDIGAGHHRRDGGGLDGRGRLVSDVGDGPQHRRVYLQVVEGQIGSPICPARIRVGGRHQSSSLVPVTSPTRRTACPIAGTGFGTVRDVKWAVVIFVAALAVAGCGSSDSTVSKTPGPSVTTPAPAAAAPAPAVVPSGPVAAPTAEADPCDGQPRRTRDRHGGVRVAA